MVVIVKKINKKYLIIGILVFVFVCLVSLGIYFSNKKENTNNNDDVKLVIKKDVSVEVMSELLNAKDFFDRDVNSNAKILYYLDDEEIDFNLKYDKVGTYKVVINIDDINKNIIEENLYQKLPPIDLLIRTSGEYRISNYMLWQMAYSEMYFTNTYFPDFDEFELKKAIEEYSKRDRRFGNIEDKK